MASHSLCILRFTSDISVQISQNHAPFYVAFSPLFYFCSLYVINWTYYCIRAELFFFSGNFPFAVQRFTLLRFGVVCVYVCDVSFYVVLFFIILFLKLLFKNALCSNVTEQMFRLYFQRKSILKMHIWSLCLVLFLKVYVLFLGPQQFETILNCLV